MAYISRLTLENCRNIRHLDIPLSPTPNEERAFLHLILTGPNGSGKSGVLMALHDAVQRNLQLQLPRLPELPGLALQSYEGPLQWTSDVYNENQAGRWIGFFASALRRLEVTSVEGPRKIQRMELWPPRLKEGFSASLLQHLVNFKMEEVLAMSEEDMASVTRVRRWFDGFQEYLRFVVGDPELRMEYDRVNFNFIFIRSDGYRFDLTQLSDGASSFLALLAELLLRIEELKKKSGNSTPELPGVVLIDEIEAHLHLRLQESILPFLTKLFPKIQFIVATHSPAVIASIPGAVVHDLGSGTTTRSEIFQGKNYGTLMTGHFGLSSELDLETTEMLRRYRELGDKSERSQKEEQERTHLRGILSKRSDTLAVELWLADGSPDPGEGFVSAEQGGAHDPS